MGERSGWAGYAVCQRIRKRIEEAFGWIKMIVGQEKSNSVAVRVGWAFTFCRRPMRAIKVFAWPS